jgi:hypothetical protein
MNTGMAQGAVAFWTLVSGGQPWVLAPLAVDQAAVRWGVVATISTVVRLEDEVRTGEKIGLVGNSGNSTEPHLHIHARSVDASASLNEGDGVPLLFDGRFLVRNSLVW